MHGNNTPVLFHRSSKQVPEIHAEALCISLCAKNGIKLGGSTIYVTFPPCHDCFKLICGAGIKRCVYKKTVISPAGDSALVAARVCGIELCGTSDFRLEDLNQEIEMVAQDSEITGNENQASSSSNISKHVQSNGESSTSAIEATSTIQPALPTPQQKEKHKGIIKRRDAELESRARVAWEEMGETTQVTRTRVKEWWERYNKRYREEARNLKKLQNPDSVEEEAEADLGTDDEIQEKKAKKEKKHLLRKGQQTNGNSKAKNGKQQGGSNEEMMMQEEEEEFMNQGNGKKELDGVEKGSDGIATSSCSSSGKRASSVSLDNPKVKETKLEETR